jgi:DNA polymerase elongation subunit (family B)
MSFVSNNIDDYIRIHKNPKIGINYILEQRLKKQKDERKEREKNQNQNKNSDANSDIDEEYDDDVSENEYVDLEKSIINKDKDKNNDYKDIDYNDNMPQHDVEFQILDIDFYLMEDDDEKKTFNIMLFGKTRDDKSVFVNVEGFKPYFYVEIDSRWRKPIIDKIIEDVKSKVYMKGLSKSQQKALKDGLIDYKIIQAHKFHGFTNDEKFNFLHVIFSDSDSMRAYARAFEKKHQMNYISRYRKMSFQLYESNILPILRFLHIKNLDPVGWCKIPKNKFKKFDDEHRKGVTDININCNWNDVERVECTDIHKFKILSFDIECVSEDGKFPHNRDGDKIIEIGMTYSYLGEDECFKKVILCLHKTSNIQGSDVKCFNSEEKLLLAFVNEIRINDPDIITGYNIFGFDFDYMKNRAKKLNILTQFSKLSRIKDFVCNYVEQKLASSALGRNNLKYYNTPGRVCIDLMKYAQREYKLGGYSLDNVAANFIRDKVVGFEYIRQGDKECETIIEETEQIIKNDKDDKEKEKEKKMQDDDYYSTDNDDEVNAEADDEFSDDIHIKKKNKDNSKKRKIVYTKLKVKSTFGIQKNDFISIYYNDGPTDNRIGYKYKVVSLENKTIILKGKVSVRLPIQKKDWKVFWCQAKDDVGPHDIFRLFKEDASSKAIIAKYCLKDCSLCNRLMAKLQILPNSIGMANVCCVPLSFLFLRGQSVKIFSLVAKQCREENYLIPTIKKKFKKDESKDKNANENNENNEQKVLEEKQIQNFVRKLINSEEENDSDDEDDKYEGATVFDPVKGVHYEPIIVGDYSSLYPSSMIMKNLSHNSIVLDPQYDNLPGYKYYEQGYNRNDPDGTTSVITCRFAEKIGDEPMKTKSTIPRILMKLLATRKKCNAMKESEKDPFKKAVWDGLQLAYKITANSLYGQCGSAVSPISMKAIAACTTSVGRDMLELARNFVENNMKTIINLIKDAIETKDETKYLEYMRKFYTNVKDSKVVLKEKIEDKTNDTKPPEMLVLYENKESYFQWLKKEVYKLIGKFNIDPLCIYGDTDSVFFKLNLVDRETNVPLINHEALKISIRMGIIGTAILNYTLDYPQGLAYEKVYWPFIIISKKRYVGNLYSNDPNEFYQKSMGLVTKRRDNADIVKMVVGGIIDQILNKRSSSGAVKFTKSSLMRIITGKYKLEKFIITKTLKDKDAYAKKKKEDDLEGWMKQAHVVLADRMTQRDPGNKPQSNDRIPFVYIEIGKNAKLQGERVEHPQFVKENNLKIDFLFYITNQIKKPAMQFLELIVKNPDALFNIYIIREQNRKDGTDPIMKHFQDCPTDQGNEMMVNTNGLVGDDLFGKKEIKTNRKRMAKRQKITKRII